MKTKGLILLVAGSACMLLLTISASGDEPRTSKKSIEAAMGPKSPKRPMTLAIAKRIVQAASKAACSYPTIAPECAGTQAVTDDAGALIYLETLDGTQTPSIDMAIQKAKTAALWHRPTEQFHDAITKGTNMSYLDGTFKDMTTAVGGVPLSVHGVMVGGFGTSGNPYLEPIMTAAKDELEKIISEGLLK